VKTKTILLIGAMVVITAYGGYRLLGSDTGAAPPMGDFAMPVGMATVEEKPLRVTLDAVGDLRANESATLRPEVAGRITDILFTEGQPIQKGAPLIQLDNRIYAAELKQAEANLRLAQLDFERFRKLSNTGAATKQRYDQAAANLSVMQANQQLAKTRLDYTTIRAPFDGVVGLRNVSPGEYVNVGQELANFISYNPMKVDFTIPETQASQVAVGQTLDVVLDAIPGQTFKGEVFALEPQLDVNGRAVALRATIPNADYLLKPGYFARVSLQVSQKDRALMIPEQAVVPQGDKKFAYVVGEDGAANMVPITLGVRFAGDVEVLEGLSAGQKVVTSGHIKLQPGAKVTDAAAMKPPADAEAKH
jgi:membrane fusion protein (multidrug efflux system)